MTGIVPLVPNWIDSYSETLEFRTEILQSRNDTEQRRAIRATPRLSISYTALADGERRRQYERFMESSLGVEVYLPNYIVKVRTTSAIALGGSTFVVQSHPTWLVADAMLVLEYERNIELVEVDSVVGNTVFLTGGVERSWPIGSKLRPLYRGTIDPAGATPLKTNRVATPTIDFTVTPTSVAYDAGTPRDTLGDREIFDIPPNFASDPTVSYDRKIDKVDYGFGVIATFLPTTFAARTAQANFLARTAEEAADIKSFFIRHLGTCREFYMPSWTDDMTLVSATSGQTHITVAGADIATVYGTSTVNKAVYLKLRDGTNYAFEVSGMSVNGENTRLTVSALPRSFLPSDVLMISWLYVARFTSDVLKIDWLTSEVANISLSVMSLEKKD